MISPLAYVDPAAKLGKNVTVQPFAYIEGDVEIGDECVIMSGARILNGTRMGKGNTVHHGAVLASTPQDFHTRVKTVFSLSVIRMKSVRMWLLPVLLIKRAARASATRTS